MNKFSVWNDYIFYFAVYTNQNKSHTILLENDTSNEMSMQRQNEDFILYSAKQRIKCSLIKKIKTSKKTSEMINLQVFTLQMLIFCNRLSAMQNWSLVSIMLS